MDTLFCITIDDEQLVKIKESADRQKKTTSSLIVERLTKVTATLENAKRLNPYPADVFIPMTNEEWEKTIQVFTDAGLSSDKVFADWGRRVWDNCIDTILKEFEE